MTARRWSIRIESSGPSWDSALAGVVKMLAEAVAMPRFIGEHTEESEAGCYARIVCRELKDARDNSPEGSLVKPSS